MPEVWAGAMTASQWLLPAAGLLAGALAGWATVLLLVHPVRPRGMTGVLVVQGRVSAHADVLSAFAGSHLVAGLPPPAKFFEQLGPDRFRREFGSALKARIDEHVDDVMSRRTGETWGGLSTYARNRVYAHVHRRLPYVVDDFVDNLQGELDDLVRPPQLVDRHLAESPQTVAAAFLDAFGADLRAALPLCALAGLAAAAAAAGLGTAPAMAAAAAAGSGVLLLALTRPLVPGGIWPFRTHGILYRRRQRFLRGLASRLANEALAWRVLAGEFLGGGQATRVRQLMRREVSAILDTPVFKATLQFLVGAEGVVAVKTSATEKALEMLASTPVSPALREHYRAEIERSLLQAADEVSAEAYAALWAEIMRGAWRRLPLLLAAAGLLLGWALPALLATLTGQP